MKHVFVDTSFWIALELDSDQNHRAAQSQWNGLRETGLQLVTTWLVFIETVTFFNSKGAHKKAVEIGNHLLESPDLDLIPLDESLLRDGWDMLQRHTDKTWSLADCVSFVVMDRLPVHEALTFDHHFDRAGFQRLP